MGLGGGGGTSTTDLSNYYTQIQVDNLLTNYYIETEANNLLDTKYSITQTNTLLDTKLNIKNPQNVTGDLTINGNVTMSSLNTVADADLDIKRNNVDYIDLRLTEL